MTHRIHTVKSAAEQQWDETVYHVESYVEPTSIPCLEIKYGCNWDSDSLNAGMLMIKYVSHDASRA